MKSLKEYIDSVTSNITEDRAATKTLLMSLMKYMQKGDDRHREVGLIAAKYLETLQRSNEQLVKIAGIVSKSESTTAGLTEEDKDELFDLIKENNSKSKEKDD